MKTYNCPACGSAMRYSEAWKMWSCAHICISASERALDAIEARQAKLMAATEDPDAAKLAAFLARQLFEVGDDPDGKCSRIQFMIGEWPNEVAGGGFVEDRLASFIEGSIKDYEEPTNKDTHENRHHI